MRCLKCKKKTIILIDCNYCKNKYCSKCTSLEEHNCNNLNDCKKRKRDELEYRLNLEKSEQNKLIKI
jgi:predicted nucleic acid binding AN1-type Zn finger protein